MSHLNEKHRKIRIIHDQLASPLRTSSMLMTMHSLLRIRPLRSPVRAFTDSLFHPLGQRILQDAAHSRRRNHALSSSLEAPRRMAQTLTEKIVQRHSLGLGKDAVVKAGGMYHLVHV